MEIFLSKGPTIENSFFHQNYMLMEFFVRCTHISFMSTKTTFKCEA